MTLINFKQQHGRTCQLIIIQLLGLLDFSVPQQGQRPQVAAWEAHTEW